MHASYKDGCVVESQHKNFQPSMNLQMIEHWLHDRVQVSGNRRLGCH